MFKRKLPTYLTAFSLIFSLFLQPVWACTGMMLKAKDGTTVNGRTVEFAQQLDLSALHVPKGYQFSGTLPDGSKGITYDAKYAVLGAATFKAPAVIDGFNEAGLSAAAFYFPGYAKYAKVDNDNRKKGLSSAEYVNWLLTQFATVDEVKKNIDKAVIVDTAPKGWGNVPPFHYVVYDKAGKSIVIEPVDGKLVVHDNPLGVITNSPTFDWHMTNLANYLTVSPYNPPTKTVDGVDLEVFGQGAGLHGLPGDFSPPSRFVRVAVFSTMATTPDNALDATLQTFHLLNQFDLPVGSIREKTGRKVMMDYTQATTVKDVKNKKYYMRTYADQSIRVLDMNGFDAKSTELTFVDVNSSQPVIDLTPQPSPVENAEES